MNMSSHLQDISLIKEAALNNLVNLLDKCEGTKTIVWDSSLTGPVGLIVPNSLLREKYSVEKMFLLEPTPLPPTRVAHVIFIIRPNLNLMDYVGSYVDADSKTESDLTKQYHVFFVPKTSLLCTERLRHKGVLQRMNLVEEFQCHLFPFDSDVVSMETADVFRECTAGSDPTYLHQTAQAIISLQNLYGPIPRVWGKGTAAKQVWDLVTRLQTRPTQASTIDQILLIDRSVDLITPLVTQLTYEGLIDEIFGINNSMVILPDVEKQIVLNSADTVFADIRDKNFNAVGPFLSEEAKGISAESTNIPEKSIQELKSFAKKLPRKEPLSRHISICKHIKKATNSYDFLDKLEIEQKFLNCIEVDEASSYIEDMMVQAKPLVQVLKLICLQCLTSSGLRPQILEHYKRELVQIYGIQTLLPIAKLEKMGLLKVRSETQEYGALRDLLKLFIENTSETNPTDINYVHSIYAPLSVRLVQQVVKNGDRNRLLLKALNLLPGQTLVESSVVPSGSTETNPDARRVVLVFFIGGCTFTEISALRFLSQQENSNVKFVIATTKLINGTSFLKSIIEA